MSANLPKFTCAIIPSFGMFGMLLYMLIIIPSLSYIVLASYPRYNSKLTTLSQTITSLQ